MYATPKELLPLIRKAKYVVQYAQIGANTSIYIKP